MVSQVKAKPAAAEALLTSMKTTFERRIWPLHAAAATRFARRYFAAPPIPDSARESDGNDTRPKRVMAEP
jgi:hypothetical protein